MEIFLLLVAGIFILCGLLFLVLFAIFFAMIKGLIKKHPKVDQAQDFIYRIHQTHFTRNKKTKHQKQNHH